MIDSFDMLTRIPSVSCSGAAIEIDGKARWSEGESTEELKGSSFLFRGRRTELGESI
jgi:hypothetical protein